MASLKWEKVENESGYPCYVDEATGLQQYDHPQFRKLIESLDECNDMKYSVYRVAFKVSMLQEYIKVPPLRLITGVFTRHKLSLSESSLSLDPDELEAVLADIFFAAEKEGLFHGDVDLTVDLLVNLLLNVYDRERKEPIRVLSAKTLLIILSDESSTDKWSALVGCAADHNACVSPKRLANLLVNVTTLASYLGEKDDAECIQKDVDACFVKSAGMLGASARAVSEWAESGCDSARWLAALGRVRHSRAKSSVDGACGACAKPIVQVLKFKCSKCSELYFCEKCYLYDNDLGSVVGHKRSHAVLEIVDGESKQSENASFIKSVRQFFFCSKKKKKKTKKSKKTIEGKEDNCQKKPAMFTSTVGKASGKNNSNNPSNMLQDIIAQLETQNMALKDLSEQLKDASKNNDGFKSKVECHWTQISTQINRLKLLKDNLCLSSQTLPTEPPKDTTERIQAFDLFSPIPVEDQKTKITDDLKTQPRVLSLDSGNFSVVSKQETKDLMTMSGDALKPIVVNATTDSISTVSMGDISSWYNENDNQTDRRVNADVSQSLCVTERRFDEDLRCVESSNDKMRELNAGLDAALDRLQQILAQNRTMDETCFDNSTLRQTASEMEGLLGSLIRGVEQRATLRATAAV